MTVTLTHMYIDIIDRFGWEKELLSIFNLVVLHVQQISATVS